MRVRFALIAAFILSLLCAFAWREWRLMGDGTLRVWFFDVGQGDSALVVTPSGKHVLIDGGPNRATLTALGRTMPFFDRTIDVIVLSHPHFDHLAAFPDVVRSYRIGRALLSGIAHDLPAYASFLAALRRQKTTILAADPTADIDLGDGVLIDVIWPRGGLFGSEGEDVNNTSVVLRVLYAGHAILFTGDMEEPAERAVLEAGIDIDSDILKIAHHGGRTSTSTGFLLAASPDLAVFSFGIPNRYGHPHPWVTRRLEHFGIPMLTTASEEDICLRFREGKEGWEEC